MPRLLTAAVLAAALGLGALTESAAGVAPPWRNCAQVNRIYRHGVGKVGAHDKTRGAPVTDFKRSNRLYQLAMRNNRGLDRDKDGIACEAQ